MNNTILPWPIRDASEMQQPGNIEQIIDRLEKKIVSFFNRWMYKYSTIYLPTLCVSHFVTPWTVARQAPLSMEFSRQEYWSGLPFLSPGDLPDPGIKPGFPALQADSLHLSYQGRLLIVKGHGFSVWLNYE